MFNDINFKKFKIESEYFFMNKKGKLEVKLISY